jgi:long-chain acyl-CoA synthetase
LAGIMVKNAGVTHGMENFYWEKGDTWPKILKYNAEKYGDRHNAMRLKDRAIWQTYTWKDYYLNVKYLALGLLSLGFQPGDKLIIAGDNKPQWYFAELAGQADHGVAVGLSSDLTTEEIKYIGANSEARFAMVEDQEQVDKLLQIKEGLPRIEKIIYWRYKGLSNYSDTRLVGYRQVLRLGETYETEHPGIFEQNVAAGNANDICAIIYTSGTTGDFPKGTVYTYSMQHPAVEYLLRLNPWHEDDNIAAYVPPAWINEQWLGIGCHLLSGGILNFAEKPETQQKDIREIGPDIIYFGSRTWERQAVATQARTNGADLLKRLIYRVLMPVGFRISAARMVKKSPRLFDKILFPLANLLILRPLRDNLGLINARICYAITAKLNPETLKFYYALKIPLINLYGLTECGLVSYSLAGDINLEAAGNIPRGVEVRISDKGELLCRSPYGFLGYYGDPEQTSKALKDGWFYSGDYARINEEGRVIFIDRLRDIAKLGCGDILIPQMIEGRLNCIPNIRDAWVMAGPDKAYTSAIIIIDYENVSRWADRKKVVYTSFNDLSQKPEVYELIGQDIKNLNKTLPNGCRIMKYANLHKEFDPDEFEMTRDRKLRKKFIEERYLELIEAIYSGKTEVPIQTPIRYSDGRTGLMKTVIRIKSVEGGR